MSGRNRKSIREVIKEVWPKLVVFTVMLMITIFQKFPEAMKALGQTDEEVKEQFRTGEFKTLEIEDTVYRYEYSKNIIFVVVMLIIYLFFKRKNDQFDDEQERLEEQKYEQEQSTFNNNRENAKEKQKQQNRQKELKLQSEWKSSSNKLKKE